MKNTVQIQKSLELTGHKGAIYTLAKSSEDGHFYSGGGDGQIVKWNIHQPEKANLIAQVDSRVFSLLLIEAQNLMVIGNMEGGLHWIDLNEKKSVSNIAHHQNGIFDIRLFEDDLLTLGGDGKLTKWSVTARRPMDTLHLSGHGLRGSDRLPGTDLLAIGSSDNAIYLVDVKNMRLVDRIDDAHENSVFTTRYSEDGNYLLSGGRDAHFKVWAVEESYKNVISHPAHWFTVNHIELIPGLNLAATASRDKTIKLWDMNTFDLLKVIDLQKNKGHINSVNRLLWLKNESLLISASDDRRLMGWKIEITE